MANEDIINDAEVIREFKEKTNEKFHELAGLKPKEIEEFVNNHVQEIISTYNLDVEIEDVVVSGSRCRGLEREDSDIDVVVYFSGDVREDDFFNILHEEGIIMGEVQLDINPVSREENGSLSEYLKGVEIYLVEKEVRMMNAEEKSNVVTFPNHPETIVTFTVAECGEFHSMGDYVDNITTIEEAKMVYDSYIEAHRNMIPAIGLNVHTAGTDDFDDIQWDFLCGNNLDLSGLSFVPDISNNKDALAKIDELVKNFPNAKVIGREEDKKEISELFVNAEMDTEKPVYIDSAARIAAEIDRFSLDFDSREYKDTVNNWEVQVQNIADDIRNGNTSEYKDYLREIISQSNDIEDVRKSAELLVKLAEYKPLAKVEEMEEENLNQIDNYLSNTVPKAEERKEIRNAEHERIEEDEQKRRKKGRQSLRARLAEKKAIVAANSKDRPKDKQREVQGKKLASEMDL